MKMVNIWLGTEPPENLPENHYGIVLPLAPWRAYHEKDADYWQQIPEHKGAMQFNERVEYVDGELVEVKEFDPVATLLFIIDAANAVGMGAQPTRMRMNIDQLRQILNSDLYKQTFKVPEL